MRSRMAWTWVEPGPERPTGPEVPTLYSLTMLPTSQVLEPARLIDMETVVLPLAALRRSAQRPPQPVRVGLSGTLVCHWTCWSLWLKSCGGTAAVLLMYCERVMGPTRVPTLVTRAALPVLKRPWRSVMLECSP